MPQVTLAFVLAAALAPMRLPSPAAQASPVARPAGDITARAAAARDAGRTSEAIELYRQALATHPRSADGWWQLGTLLYDADRYAEATDAFQRCTALTPRIGTAWVMRGLSEFKLGRADDALAHIQRGKALGTTSDPQFRRVMLYTEGVLLLGKSEFERAQEILAGISTEGAPDDAVMLALGMSVLRLRPSEVQEGAATTHAMAQRAGAAEALAAQKRFDEALRSYESLANDFPQARNVHYALGRYFVATRQPERAVVAYEQEIALFPDHVPARLGVAAIKAETDPTGALPYAEAAVHLNPRIPLGHYLLGTLLLHTTDTTRAITELETARAAVPEDPGVHYALGRAYVKAGRPADAARARAEFKRLTDARQAAAREAAEKPAAVATPP